MKKRLSFVLLALCMALVLLPGTAWAEEEVQNPITGTYGDNITWEYKRAFDEYGDEQVGGTLTIRGDGDMTGDSSTYSTPWRYYGDYISTVIIESGVTSIGNYAFFDCSSLTSITIPDSVTVIGGNAFFGCSSLTSITIPDSVTTIGEDAFYNCSSLTSITIPNSVTTIGWGAFEYCDGLTSISIPGTVNIISGNLFNGCSNLSEVTIQNGVKYIEDYVFSECNALNRISIPESVIRMGDSLNGAVITFERCDNLTEIVVDSQNTEYSSQDGALFTKEKDTLLLCPAGKTAFTIPNGVVTIGNRAFALCKKLSAVTIPNSVTTIRGEAFFVCSSLDNVTIPNSVTSIGGSAFGHCTSLTNITISNQVRDLSTIFEDCTSLTEIEIPEGVAGLSGTFSGCSNLKTVHLPISLTAIGSNTFYNCFKLNSIVYSGNETQWGTIEIASGNAEIDFAEISFLNLSDPNTPDEPDNPDTPDNPDDPDDPDNPDNPDTPETPDTPDNPDTSPETLSLTVTNGGIGKRVTVTIEGGHWLTIQTRRSGSISITSVRAPGSGMVELAFSSAAGSSIQVWETAEEMVFENGVPTNRILATASRSL